MQTGCMMLLVNYPDSQRGQSPAHESMQESHLCMQSCCVCLGVYLLPQQTVRTEIGRILHWERGNSSGDKADCGCLTWKRTVSDTLSIMMGHLISVEGTVPKDLNKLHPELSLPY